MTGAKILLTTRRALIDEVSDALVTLLMEGELAPDQRINIEVVAKRLGVSATPVRESLARLESQGLVEKQTRKGYTASALLDRRGFVNLFDLRHLLEPTAAHLAASDATTGGGIALKRSIEAMLELERNADSNSENYRALVEWDSNFHNQVAALSGNPLLADAVARLRPHVHLYRLVAYRNVTAQTYEEHTRIADAIIAGQPAKAREAMAEHLRRSRGRVDHYFELADGQFV